MRRGRRGFLLRLLGALPGATLWRAAGAGAEADARVPDAPDMGWLELVADAVVPGDDTPGAVQAGVVPRLLASVTGDPRRTRLYAQGRRHLEKAARAGGAEGFATLSVDDRTRLLQTLLEDMAAAPEARAFYFQLRADVLGLFYTSPTGWRAVGYRPPPYPYPAEREPAR
jgi:hypothetical protein